MRTEDGRDVDEEIERLERIEAEARYVLAHARFVRAGCYINGDVMSRLTSALSAASYGREAVATERTKA